MESTADDVGHRVGRTADWLVRRKRRAETRARLDFFLRTHGTQPYRRSAVPPLAAELEAERAEGRQLWEHKFGGRTSLCSVPAQEAPPPKMPAVDVSGWYGCAVPRRPWAETEHMALARQSTESDMPDVYSCRIYWGKRVTAKETK